MLITLMRTAADVWSVGGALRLPQVLIKPRKTISSALVAGGGGLLSLVNTCGETGLCTPCMEAHPPWRVCERGLAKGGGGPPPLVCDPPWPVCDYFDGALSYFHCLALKQGDIYVNFGTCCH